MLRVSILALCCILPAHGAEIALSGQGEASLVRKERKQSDVHTQSSKVVEEIARFSVQREGEHAHNYATCAQIKQGFHKTEKRTRQSFCELLKNDEMDRYAPCCQENPDADCCADANDCQISEVYDALDMGKCNEGAGASLVMQARVLDCTSIDAQFQKEGSHHTIATFCADVVTFSLQSVATCCANDPPDCCERTDHCEESEIYEALGKPECSGRRRE